MTRDQAEESFDDSFCEGFLKEVVRMYLACYREAPDVLAAAGVTGPFARWDLPLLRRGLIQTRLAALAADWPTNREDGIRSQIEYAKNGGGAYTLITAGPFHLTASMIDQPDELPRMAGFRAEKSRARNPGLFDDPDETAKRDTIYAVLTDLPHPTRMHEPAAIRVKIPDEDFKSVFHQIDILARFDFLLGGEPVQEETIKEPEPKLREDLGKPDAGAEDGQEKVG